LIELIGPPNSYQFVKFGHWSFNSFNYNWFSLVTLLEQLSYTIKAWKKFVQSMQKNIFWIFLFSNVFEITLAISEKITQG
jgi:hypothetical protein